MFILYEDGLKIYLRDGYLELEYNNLEELISYIVSLTGIDQRLDGKGLYLCLILFFEPDPSWILSIFKRFDIPVDFSENRDEDGE